MRVELPAEPGFLRIARLNATAYGSRVDLDVDQLDDLRLAVNEALTWMIDDPDGPETMVLRIYQDGDQVVVAGGPDRFPAAATGATKPSPLDGLVAAILEATVDDFWLDPVTPRRFELRKGATDPDLCI